MADSATFLESVGGDGSTVTGDANPTTGLANGGHRKRFVNALAQVVAVAQHVVDTAEDVAAVAPLLQPAIDAAATATAAATAASDSADEAEYWAGQAAGSVTGVVSIDGQQGILTTKTINSESILGVGNISLQQPLVSGTSIKTVQGQTLLGAGNVQIDINTLSENRSSNTILTSADNRKVIFLTGDFTQTLQAAATLGAGWSIRLVNVGGSDIVIDPANSELIGGNVTYTLMPTTSVDIYCDGVGFQIASSKIGSPTTLGQRAVFLTSTQSFIVPSDVYQIRAYAFGAGGNASAGGHSGGGGGCAFGTIATTPKETLSVSIASGIAKLLRGATALITGNPASGSTGGTATKNASVINGGAFSGGNGQYGYFSGASSGSPLGNGYSVALSGFGGSGWGGVGNGGAGGGAAAAATGVDGMGGRAFTEQELLALSDPLLRLCDGRSNVPLVPLMSISQQIAPSGCGGFFYPSLASGQRACSGGFGGGGAQTTVSGTYGGNGGFGGGGGYGQHSGGAGGFAGGGGAGQSSGGVGGGACVVIFY